MDYSLLFAIRANTNVVDKKAPARISTMLDTKEI